MTRAGVFYISLLTLVMVGLNAHSFQEGQPLRFGVSASIEATDNRDASESDKESNIDLFLRPYVAYHLDGAVTSLQLRYEPGLRYRTDPGDRQNDVDLHHELLLHVRHAFTARSRMRVRNEFRKIEDPRIEEGGSILRADRSYILNTVRGALNYDVGQLSNLDLAVHNQIRRYDDAEIARLSDKNEIGVTIGYRRALSQTTIALLNASYDTYDLEAASDRSRDFDSITGSMGIEYIFLPELIGSVLVGAQTRSYDESDLETEDNVYVRAELSGDVGHNLRMGITTGYGVREADIFPYASQEYIETRGFADFSVTSLLSLRGALTYRKSSYDGKADLNLDGGDEEVIVVDAQITYEINELASVVAGHRFEDVSADDGLLSGSFTRNTSRVGVRLDF